MIDKACAVLLRDIDGTRQILAFQHPTAGNQLVKGSIEKGETYEEAARRELAEESGILSVGTSIYLGDWIANEQHWHFVKFEVEHELPDQWEFFTADDGGMQFNFFWFDLDESPDQAWHPVFVQALEQIKELLK